MLDFENMVALVEHAAAALYRLNIANGFGSTGVVDRIIAKPRSI